MELYMGILSPILATLFGCSLFGSVCGMPPNMHGVSIQTYATSSPDVTVVTSVNGSTTTQTIPAPYGVQTSVIEKSNGGTPIVQASTTPLTSAQVSQMQQQTIQQVQAMQQQMNQMFADQEKFFQDMWNNFPQAQ